MELGSIEPASRRDDRKLMGLARALAAAWREPSASAGIGRSAQPGRLTANGRRFRRLAMPPASTASAPRTHVEGSGTATTRPMA